MRRSLSCVFLCSASAVKGFLFRQHQPHPNPTLLASMSSSSSPPSSSSLASAAPDAAGKYRFLTSSGGDESSSSSSSSSGIRNVVDDYDVFLLDMWGVMHDGIRPYEGVPEVVWKLKEANKKLIILSNSSKRRTNSVKMLKKLGFADDAFDEIITSGEVAHHLLRFLSSSSEGEDESFSLSWVPKKIPGPFLELRNKRAAEGTEETQQQQRQQQPLSAFCFGSGDADEDYLNSCGFRLAESIETADLIVSRGTFVVLSATECSDKTQDEDAYWSAYRAALEAASSSENPIPMVVCNPDKVRPDADKSPMPGTIGVAYQELLKKKSGNDNITAFDDLILSLGKPFPDVYEIALSSIAADGDESIDKSRVVMVGDALETDVTGATATGIDSVWVVQDGIHNQDILDASPSSVEKGCEAVLESFNEHSETTYARGKKVSPTVVLPHFRW